jgi:hypothetical protein
MKSILTLKFILVAACFIILSHKAKAQDDMTPPPPAKNESMEMLMGTWKAEPYEFMGAKWSDVSTYTMKHGGYFMFIDISGQNDKGLAYSATIILKSDVDGNLTGWSFDDWGGVTNYTGKSSKNKVTVSSKNDWGTETREIEINGNSMVHKVVTTMKGKDGKEMTMNTTVTYNKQ